MSFISQPAKQKLRSQIAVLLVLGLFAGLSGCATRSVARTEISEAIDLSGMWNDTDSQLVSREMIGDCLTRSWPADWKDETGKKPRVIVGTVRNLSMEHLNTGTFVRDLERELTNSGKVRFVASRDQRNQIRRERADQDANASASSAKSMGQESGADFMLIGQVDQINDSVEGQQVRYYQVELEMVEVESNEKVWIGQKKIKKLVKQRRYKF